MNLITFRNRYLAAQALLLVLTGCHAGAPAGSASGSPPAQEVSVVTLQPQRVTLTTELPGRTSPYRIAEVRPQIGGVILKRMFTEGGDVMAGQQLYQIDPAPYQVAADSAQATLAHAEAVLTSANLLAERDKPLMASHAVSTQDYDNAVAALQQAQADVASAKASIEGAQINLVYTKVLSPISGRTGRAVTEGALVTSSQVASLVTVQQLDPIYVDISQSTAVLLRLQRELANGQLQGAGPTQANVKLMLEDGSLFDQTGQLQFAEANVDQGTGSVILRAVFPNPKHLLLPGMFVRAELEEGVAERGILVPQQAVTHDPKGSPTALIVTADNKVELRTIKTAHALGDKWLVTEGVGAGDRVIVEGLQKVQPGAVVHPTEATNDGTAATVQQ